MQRDDMHGGCDCSFFDYGDWVEFKLDENLFGIVIDADIHGLIYAVQLAGSGQVRRFHGVTLRHMEADDLPPASEDLPADVADKVIDFTKEKQLRANTKTRGAA